MNAVAYYRLSREDADSNSIDTQRRVVLADIAANGDTFIGEFTDMDVSGSVPPLDRDGFSDAYDLACANLPCRIACWKVDRFSRDVSDGTTFLKTIKPVKGFRLTALDFSGDYTKSAGKFVFTVLLLLAEDFVNATSDKTTENLQTLRTKGVVGGPVPYGYLRTPRRKMGDKTEGGVFVEDHATHPKWAREAILAAMKSDADPAQVARELMDDGVRNRDGTWFWTARQVRRLMMESYPAVLKLMEAQKGA